MKTLPLIFFIFLSLTSCDKGTDIRHGVEEEETSVSISRSTSEFQFEYQGHIDADFRIFGFNPNPFGKNNRDDYIASFGLPLLTTHILIASGVDAVAKEYARTNCEKSGAENAYKISIIANDQIIADKLNALAKKSKGSRICARITGKDLRFQDWILNGSPRDRSKLARMTKKAGGIDFANPLLLEEIEEINC